VCPLRGQSLEARPAVQPSVVRARPAPEYERPNASRLGRQAGRVGPQASGVPLRWCRIWPCSRSSLGEHLAFSIGATRGVLRVPAAHEYLDPAAEIHTMFAMQGAIILPRRVDKYGYFPGQSVWPVWCELLLRTTSPRFEMIGVRAGSHVPYNKALHQTKGARSGRFAAGHPEAPFAGEGRCSTAVDVQTATAVGTSKRISVFVGWTEIFAGSRSSNPRGGYGGILEVAPGAKVGTVGAPWSGRISAERSEGLGEISIPSNNGMQLTKAARCAPFAFPSWGQSLRAAFAAELGGCAGHR